MNKMSQKKLNPKGSHCQTTKNEEGRLSKFMHVKDSIVYNTSMPFNPSEFMQNTVDLKYNYCHKKGHFSNECKKQVQDHAHGIPKHQAQANMVKSSFNNLQIFLLILNQTLM
jgi:hypothetical protein